MIRVTEWEFRPYQKHKGEQVLLRLNKYSLAYIAMEERTGKNGTFIYAANKARGVNKVVILTTKKAMIGCKEALSKFPVDFEYEISTYHSSHKVTLEPDLVVLDEAHNYISASPKVGKLWRQAKKLTKGALCLYLSATPHAQGYQMLYHQFKLSFNSPWQRYRNYYDWYREYAIRDSKGSTVKQWINGTLMETYTDVKTERIKREIDKYFVRGTRKELGFKHEPNDKLHYVALSTNINKAYNKLVKSKVLNFNLGNKSYSYVADTGSKLRTALHQLEGGTLIMHDSEDVKIPLILSDTSKIDYVKKHFGDSDNMVIMYNYRAELPKLQEHFKHAELAQATSNAEGVDYYHKEHLIIYSQDYSTARHVQRRARQTNMERDTPIIVHFILVKEAISEQVYNTVVTNKRNFVDSTFNRKTIGK